MQGAAALLGRLASHSCTAPASTHCHPHTPTPAQPPGTQPHAGRAASAHLPPPLAVLVLVSLDLNLQLAPLHILRRCVLPLHLMHASGGWVCRA